MRRKGFGAGGKTRAYGRRPGECTCRHCEDDIDKGYARRQAKKEIQDQLDQDAEDLDWAHDVEWSVRNRNYDEEHWIWWQNYDPNWEETTDEEIEEMREAGVI